MMEVSRIGLGGSGGSGSGLGGTFLTCKCQALSHSVMLHTDQQ